MYVLFGQNSQNLEAYILGARTGYGYSLGIEVPEYQAGLVYQRYYGSLRYAFSWQHENAQEVDLTFLTQIAHYPEIQPLFSRNRTDLSASINLQWNIPLSKKWQWRFNLNSLVNDSDIALYRYSRHTLSAGINLTY